MNKGNLVLGGVLLVLIAVWAMQRGGTEEVLSGPSPRLFGEFNREAAAGILIEGGWKGFPYEYRRGPDGWVLESAGGFPVKKETVEEFVDAVANLRRENLVGESDDLKKTSRTSDTLGRKVTVYRDGGEPMATFYVGKHPRGEWQSYFIRAADDDRIYRTKTVTGDEEEPEPNPFPGMGGGAQGFDWAQHANNAHRFVNTQIWNLDDGEVREILLERKGDGFKAKLVREEQEQWSLEDDGKVAKADTAAVESITGGLSYLAFEEVVGRVDDPETLARYGLDKPAIELVLTMRREIKDENAGETKDDAGETKDDAEEEGAEEDGAGEDGEDGEDGENGDDGEEKKDDAEANQPKYETFVRIIRVGSKVEVPNRFDDEKGEAEEREYYAISVRGDLKDPTRTGFIYLVDDYKVGPLKKSMDELRRKEEAKPGDGEDAADSEGDEGTADETMPGDDEKKPEEKKPEEPKTEDPNKSEPKADEPKTDEPKVAEPKTEDPKTDEPKSEDPKSEDPKTEDPKTEDPKTEDPKSEDPK